MAFMHKILHGYGMDIPEKNKMVSRLSNSRDLNRINVTQLNNGESAKVVELLHNSKIISKLEAMGIIPGAIITKKSAVLAKGPVILEKGLVQFAIGYGIAQKIIVKPVEMESGSGV